MAIEKGSKGYAIATSIIYIVLGVLLCISLINVDQILSYVLGIALIIAAVAFLVIDFVKLKELLPSTIIVCAFLLAVGIGIIIWPFGFTYYLSMLVLVLGALLLVEGIIWLIKKRPLFTSVGILVVGAAALTFGICFFAVDGFAKFCSLILGILLILLGALSLVQALTKKSK